MTSCSTLRFEGIETEVPTANTDKCEEAVSFTARDSNIR